MSALRPARPVLFAPTWRSGVPEPVVEARTFIVCRCGVDMLLLWPREADALRCLGCGARFLRPEHLAPEARSPSWAPPPACSVGGPRARAAPRPARLFLLGLALLAALFALGSRLLGRRRRRAAGGRRGR